MPSAARASATARTDVYGLGASEKVVGQLLRELLPRDEYVLATKIDELGVNGTTDVTPELAAVQSMEIHLDGETEGHRIEVHGWLEDGPKGNAGEVTVKRVDGDNWRRPSEFVRHESKLLENPSDEEIEATVRAMADAASR